MEGTSSDDNPNLHIQEMPREIEHVLQNYPAVFELPHGLPPKRAVDHRIVLNEGQPPVNVRPYKYAHSQKSEIEKLIEETLYSGITHL